MPLPMTTARIALEPQPDGSWKMPGCECIFHPWMTEPYLDGKDMSGRQVYHGYLSPVLNACPAHQRPALSWETLSLALDAMEAQGPPDDEFLETHAAQIAQMEAAIAELEAYLEVPHG